jgi:hypothetical protein
MYSKKYIIQEVKEFNGHNPVYDEMKNAICYPAYLKIGERGLLLYDNHGSIHKICTSVIRDVTYGDCGYIVVITQNSAITFKGV